MPVEGFRDHVATDASLFGRRRGGGSGRWDSCG